jgi:hypothetical protein
MIHIDVTRPSSCGPGAAVTPRLPAVLQVPRAMSVKVIEYTCQWLAVCVATSCHSAESASRDS